jgi:L,D-transpeptidase ErfK/SrfK
MNKSQLVPFAAVVVLSAMCGWIPRPVHGEDVPPLSDAIVGEEFLYTVRQGESLTKIGARFGENPALLARENGLRFPSLLKPGTILQIDNRHIVPNSDLTNGILINIPQRMLFHIRSTPQRTAYPVGLGRPSWPTPTGRFRIIGMQRDKEWIVPESIQEEMRQASKEVLTRVPPGPDNPLGKYWIGLSLGSIGIHGTIAPSSVYHFQSHGCVRLHPDDIESLYAETAVGERGSLVYFPVLVAREAERLYLEVNGDIYKHGINPLAVVHEISSQDGLDDLIDWNQVDAVIEEKAGIAREIGRR